MTFVDRALVAGGVDPEISAAIAIAERLKPLKDALGIGDLTEAEMHLFAMVALHTGLDPFTRQIYAVKRKGKVVHQTGIDGYRSVAEDKGGGQYAGSDEATYEVCECDLEPKGHPKIARVVVHRILSNGHVVDQVGVARWHELFTGDTEQFMWRKMPFNQLAKCAEANGLRKAFPRVLGGVYIEEEMEQANTVDGTATVLPTAAERIAARRLAAQAAPAVEFTGLPREAFLAELAAAGIAPSAASERSATMFPDTDPKSLSDEQRFELYLDLTGPQDAPSLPLFDDTEDAALDQAIGA